MPKITKRLIDTVKTDSACESFVWDSELRGFGVRVMPSGMGSYILKYRKREGRQRKIALARIGAVTPDEARDWLGSTWPKSCTALTLRLHEKLIGRLCPSASFATSTLRTQEIASSPGRGRWTKVASTSTSSG